MTGAHDDALHRLLRSAGDDVHPHDRWDEIRRRTRPDRRSLPSRLAPLAAAAAVVVVVGGVALSSQLGGDDPDRPAATPTPTFATDTTPVAPSDDAAIPVYYVGDTRQGPRLFREFQNAPDGPVDRRVDEAVARAVLGPARDPDYRSSWPAGTQAHAEPWDGDVLTVVLEPADTSAGDLRVRPAGMSAEEARLAVQQLVYSGQAALQAGRVPVRFLIDGEPVDTLLGVPVGEPVANDPVLETLSLVNLTTPGEGDEVAAVLDVEGVANAFEGTVVLSVLRDGEELLTEPLIADGWTGARLFPFRHTLDLSALSPGTYTLEARVESPGEDHDVYTDTRTVTVR